MGRVFLPTHGKLIRSGYEARLTVQQNSCHGMMGQCIAMVMMPMAMLCPWHCCCHGNDVYGDVVIPLPW